MSDGGKAGLWKALAVAACVLAAAVAVAAFALGGCSAVVETAAGATVPMKCHWTFRAVGVLGALALACAVGWFFVPGGHGRHLGSALYGLHAVAVLVCLYTPVMGLCANAAMECHSEAVVLTVIAVCQALLAVIAYVKATPAKPKRQL